MRFEKIWAEQCEATKAIRRRFGAKSALDYLIGEKLIRFADAAQRDPKFAKERPKSLAAVWHTFNEYEIAGYVASRKPAARKSLRQLLYELGKMPSSRCAARSCSRSRVSSSATAMSVGRN